MNWDDARWFLAICRAGSLARAAGALNADHTTVGRRLSAFERSLGVRLFVRRRDGVAMTAAGTQLYDLAIRAEAAMLSVERMRGVLDAGAAGDVRLATSSILVTGFVAGGLPRFAVERPQLALELLVGRALVSLARNEADLALRLRPRGAYVAEPSTLASTIGTVGWAAYSARDPVSELQICYPQLRASPGMVWLERQQPRAQRLLVDDVPSALALAAAGSGTALLPCFLAEPRAELQRRSAVLEEHRLIVVATREARRIQRVAEVMAWLQCLAREQRRLLAGPRG